MAPGGRQLLKFGSARTMPIISEDDAVDPPSVPMRSSKRLTTPEEDSEYAAYLAFAAEYPAHKLEDGSLPDRTPAPAQRQGFWDHAKIAKRGGWYRMGLAALFIIALVVGLSVGLTVGLHKSRGDQESLPMDYFPTGSWTFTTALSDVSTACTTDADTFRCYPYSTYNAASPNTSAATFNWIITPVTSDKYVISSSENPFAPSFTNVSMQLLDPDQSTERFVFSLPMAKASVASSALPGTDQSATCWFNSTLMTATIWTRTRAVYPARVTTLPDPRNASTNFAPWPYRVDVKQTQSSGPNVPDCRDKAGRSVGDFHVDPSGGRDAGCSCVYTNYGLLPTSS